MTYRDDREALHTRNAALEAEVASLRQPEARPRPPGRLALLVTLGCVGLVLAAGGSWLVRPRPETPRYDERLTGTAAPVWQGVVQEASGWVALQPGTACTFEGVISFERNEPQSVDVRVRCGDQVVYDPRVPARPMGATRPFEVTSRQVTEQELPLFNPENVERIYDVTYDDRGVPSPLTPRLTLDTKAGTAVIVRRDPPLHVRLQVTPGSAPISLSKGDTHR